MVQILLKQLFDVFFQLTNKCYQFMFSNLETNFFLTIFKPFFSIVSTKGNHKDLKLPQIIIFQ